LTPGLWNSATARNPEPPQVKKLRSSYDVICLAENDIQFGRIEEKKSGNNFIHYFLEKYIAEICLLRFYFKSVGNC
jgi:hypothetical protein